MIASIIITALNKAESLSYKAAGQPGALLQTVWVTAVDHEDERNVKRLKRNFDQGNIKHFHQLFRDWSDEDPDPYVQTWIEQQGPQERHINNIISFLEPFVASKNEHHLGVNCMAGMCRSTAIGIIAWVMQGLTPQQAIIEIEKVRPILWPNLRMLKFASARLGIDLYTPVLNWKLSKKTSLL